MVGGVVTVLFGDGSTASATLAADGSNAGAIAIVGTSGLESAPGLNVNGLGPGGVGSYGASNPSVVVSSNPGDIVRVSLTEGFSPVATTKTVAEGQITVKDLVEARLEAQYPEFPANNAKRWEHEEVVIPQSGSVDVSSLFSLSGDNLPIAYVAVVVDNSSKDPLSETTAPIRLRYSEGPVAAPVTLPPVPTASPVMLAPVSQGSDLPWIENFEGLVDGSKSDIGVTSWTATRGSGTFEVQAGKLVINNGGGEGFLITGEIDISAGPVDISLDLYTQSTGDGMETSDYVDLFALVDGEEAFLGGVTGELSSLTTISEEYVTGSTLQVVIRASVSYFGMSIWHFFVHSFVDMYSDIFVLARCR